jgi:ADP-heptose:LPS heptosyltransferase
MSLPTGPDATYEDAFSRPRRWVRRLLRPLQWHIRGLLGLRRVLLVELRWRLGDEIMARPVVEALAARHPRDEVWLWTNFPEFSDDFLPKTRLNRMPPAVHRYCFLRSAPRTVYRPLHYARLAGVPAPVTPPRILAPPLSPALCEKLAELPRPWVAIAPGASWANKRWPADHWAALTASLRRQGLTVIELGCNDTAVPGVSISLMNQTTPAEAAAVLAACDAAITCDSGLMHLALAVTTPTVALFGPTDPAYLVRSPLLHAISNGLPCAGHWNQSEGTLEPGVCRCGKPTCLATITPESVQERLLAALASERSRTVNY